MPYSIQVLADEDVILVTFTGFMTRADVMSSVNEVVKLADSMPCPVYQIGDFRQAEGTFASVFEIIRTFPMVWRMYSYNQITGPIAVNNLNNPWLKLSYNLALKINLKEMLTFATLDEAYDYVKAQKESYSNSL